MPTLDEYMAQYDHEHTSLWNKTLHGIGIPIIFAGIILVLILRWQLGLALFIFGWILLFAGHKLDGNMPAFLQGGPIYFLVGRSGWRRKSRMCCWGAPGAHRRDTDRVAYREVTVSQHFSTPCL